MIRVIIYHKDKVGIFKPIKRIECDSIAIHPYLYTKFTKNVECRLYCFFHDKKDEDYGIEIDKDTGIKIISIDPKK